MSVRVLVGDCRDRLAELESGSVQTCVTSPPYLGLRDYGTASWNGGDPSCDHERARSRTGFDYGLSDKQQSNRGSDVKAYGRTCPCGAVRIDKQIGLEDSPAAFVAVMVDVFREVRRMLADDGTLWLNLGDSYANDAKWGGATGGKHATALHGEPIGRRRRDTGLPPKSLMGLPWRVAFALQDDGWILRSDIVWHKPNCMPESVQDRPTSAHEHIFLFAKTERYYYDASAIAEPAREWTGSAATFRRAESKRGVAIVPGQGCGTHRPDRKQDAVGKRTYSGFNERWDTSEPSLVRNKRDVWTVPVRPYAEAHFATYPAELIEPCILAGSRPGDTVLDPFAGSGTTLAVAVKHRRKAVGVELNPAYAALIDKRLNGVQVTLPFDDSGDVGQAVGR